MKPQRLAVVVLREGCLRIVSPLRPTSSLVHGAKDQEEGSKQTLSNFTSTV